MMMRITGVMALSITVAACAPVERSGPRFAVADEDTAVRITGEAVTCLRTADIRRSQVRGRDAIDFETAGGQVYRNRLDPPCSGLRRNEGISYNTSIGQLCRGEIVYTLEQIGDRLEQGAGCGLSEFVPIEYIDPIDDAPRTAEDE